MRRWLNKLGEGRFFNAKGKTIAAVMKVTRLTLSLPTLDVTETYEYYTKMLGFRGGYHQSGSCAVVLGGLCLVFRSTGRVSQTLIQQVRVAVSVDDLHAYHTELQSDLEAGCRRWWWTFRAYSALRWSIRLECGFRLPRKESIFEIPTRS